MKRSTSNGAAEIIKAYSKRPIRKHERLDREPESTDWLTVTFREFHYKPSPTLSYHVRLALRGGVFQEYDQDALVFREKLISAAEDLEKGASVDIKLLSKPGGGQPLVLHALRAHSED